MPVAQDGSLPAVIAAATVEAVVEAVTEFAPLVHVAFVGPPKFAPARTRVFKTRNTL
jgi:hypothetical protein